MEEELERLKLEIESLKKELAVLRNPMHLQYTGEVVDAMTSHQCDLAETEEDKERCRMGKLPLKGG